MGSTDFLKAREDDGGRGPYQFQSMLAQLEEGAGRRESAIAAYRATLQELGSRGDTAGPIARSREALVRLARR